MKAFWILLSFYSLSGCFDAKSNLKTVSENTTNSKSTIIQKDSISRFQKDLSDHALSIVDPSIRYISDYVSISYPNGDVPPKTGVCTDVIIRTYRRMNIDLQKEVHEDMSMHFDAYPKLWGLRSTDTNIDHRRVPNLQTFFERNGTSFPVTQNPEDYRTGAIVTWMIGDKMPHIGIVTERLSSDKKRRLIVHNVGNGQVLEDCLFRYKITGHYFYEPN